jgi:hypothetical protein
MLATQYAITLPADYDMGIIRRRIAARARLLDHYPGLGLKAYLVQDVANGARQNQYAPFYLWADTSATASFFWGGGGFSGIVRDFGRPSVSTWIGVDYRTGPAFRSQPVVANLVRRPLTATDDPALEAERLREAVDRGLTDADVHSIAAVIDPTRWEAVTFTLRTTDAPASVGATRFEVLHLSAPSPLSLTAHPSGTPR